MFCSYIYIYTYIHTYIHTYIYILYHSDRIAPADMGLPETRDTHGYPRCWLWIIIFSIQDPYIVLGMGKIWPTHVNLLVMINAESKPSPTVKSDVGSRFEHENNRLIYHLDLKLRLHSENSKHMLSRSNIKASQAIRSSTVLLMTGASKQKASQQPFHPASAMPWGFLSWWLSQMGFWLFISMKSYRHNGMWYVGHNIYIHITYLILYSRRLRLRLFIWIYKDTVCT